jgi:hypothetical protein
MFDFGNHIPQPKLTIAWRIVDHSESVNQNGLNKPGGIRRFAVLANWTKNAHAANVRTPTIQSAR